MKEKTWIIILIMGIALIISLSYSLMLRKKVDDISSKESVIVSRSIVQITASNVSIKNVLTIKGKVEKKIEQIVENEQNVSSNSNQINTNDQNAKNNESSQNTLNESQNIEYKITLNLNEEAAKKVKEGKEAEIKIEQDGKTLKYKGKISKIENNTQTKTCIATVEFNFDENIKENMEVACTVVVEEAKDVIAVPLAAVKTREKESNLQNKENTNNTQNLENTTDNQTEEEKYVIVVNDDGTTSEVVVETGISDDSYVEIRSGLSEGQKVQIVEE